MLGCIIQISVQSYLYTQTFCRTLENVCLVSFTCQIGSEDYRKKGKWKKRGNGRFNPPLHHIAIVVTNDVGTKRRRWGVRLCGSPPLRCFGLIGGRIVMELASGCRAGDETFRALSSGMLKEEEEEGLRGINVLWKDGSDHSRLWTAFGWFSISMRQKLAGMSNRVNRVLFFVFLHIVSVQSNASPTNQTIIWDKGHLLPLRMVCGRFSRTRRVITKRMACLL